MRDGHPGATLSFADLVRVKEAAQPWLFRLSGVTGVAIGPKQRGGQLTGRIAIIVYVEEKKPLQALAPEDVVPPVIEGIQTDVLRLGAVRPLSGPSAPVAAADDKPVLVAGMELTVPGFQLEHGTLGCFVVEKGTTEPHYFLTNQHVVLPYNDETPLNGEVRAAGMKCSSCTAGKVGVVTAVRVRDPVSTWLPKIGNPTQQDEYNINVDAALVRLDAGMKWQARVDPGGDRAPIDIEGDDELIDLYKLYYDKSGSTAALAHLKAGNKAIEALHYKVFKVGSATGYTEGVLESVHGVHIHPVPGSPQHELGFVDQLTIRSLDPDKPFAEQGDSGSVILNKDHKVIGLLWGGDKEEPYAGATPKAVASPIKPILDLFGIAIATKATHPGVQTAPGSSNAALAPDAGDGPAWAASAPLDTWSLRARMQAELLQTPGGQRYAQLILKHQQEVRTLVETNKRVAAVWRRNGGPFIVHHLVEAARHPDQPLPPELDGKPLGEALQDIFRILRKHGSAALAADIAAHQERFTALIRLSYTQLLERLRTFDA